MQVMLRNTSQQRQDNKKKNQNLHLGGTDNAADAGATRREREVARCVTLGREFQQEKKNNVNRKKNLPGMLTGDVGAQANNEKST